MDFLSFQFAFVEIDYKFFLQNFPFSFKSDLLAKNFLAVQISNADFPQYFAIFLIRKSGIYPLFSIQFPV